MNPPPLIVNAAIGVVGLALWWNGPAIDDVLGNIINAACGLGGLLNILYVTINIIVIGGDRE
jgi:hypothetical protein